MPNVEDCEKEREAKQRALELVTEAQAHVLARDYIAARRLMLQADNWLLNAGVWKASKEDCHDGA
jgi:hypothetical protein